VRAGYAQRRAAQPGRFEVLDASKTPEDVWAQLMRALEARQW